MFMGKQICDSCEHTNSPTATLCIKCGTALDDTIAVPELFREELLQRVEESKKKFDPTEVVTIQLDAQIEEFLEQELDRSQVQHEDIILVEQNTGIKFNVPHVAFGTVVIGRANSAKGYMPSIDLSEVAGRQGGVSRYHASLVWYDDNLQLFDHNSKNGTYLNGKRLTSEQAHILHDNDFISFGYVKFRLNLE